MKKNIKDLIFYYNKVEDEITTKIDKNTPPEYYFTIGISNSECYIDVWVDKTTNKKLTIAYTDLEINNFGWNNFIYMKLKENDMYAFGQLESRMYPFIKFKELLKEYGINTKKLR